MLSLDESTRRGRVVEVRSGVLSVYRVENEVDFLDETFCTVVCP